MVIVDPYKGDDNEPEIDYSNNILFKIYTIPFRVIKVIITILYFLAYVSVNRGFLKLGYRVAKKEITIEEMSAEVKKLSETQFFLSFTEFNKHPSNRVVISSFIYLFIYLIYFNGN